MAKEDSTSETSTPKPSPLHPAYSVSNIQTKIRTLDGNKVTYSLWVRLFHLDAIAYKVLNHIDGTPVPVSPAAGVESWQKLDALVLQWIYSTVSDDLKDILSNKKARTAVLETKFYNLSLAACSSVEDYCQRLTDLSNQLADVDKPVFESRFVLQLVSGLPEEYNTTASLTNQQEVDWDQAITMPNDEVIRLDARKGSTTTVLAAPPAPTQQQQNAVQQQQPQASDPAAFSSRGRGRG
ncbi:uncharacterized protein LOC143541112 [Bidens hawaiensis]|uniref:uncharacterized protein LOC143541112 n=1 Tax=Bidens hawaiensis TaxID=980011 RepID=UPI00404B2A39